MKSKDSGYTIIEVLVVMAVIAVLAGTAIANFQVFSVNSRDAAASSDYRNIKVAVFEAFLSSNESRRYVTRRLTGPATLPEPLQEVRLSSDVEVSVFHLTRIRRNRPPRTLTTISVRHLTGSKVFRFTESNGNISEDVVSF